MGRKHLSLVLEDKIYPQKRRLLRPGTVNVIYFCTKSYSIQFKIPKKLKKKRPFITICIVVSVTVRDCRAYGIYLIFWKQTIHTYFVDNFFYISNNSIKQPNRTTTEILEVVPKESIFVQKYKALFVIFKDNFFAVLFKKVSQYKLHHRNVLIIYFW